MSKRKKSETPELFDTSQYGDFYVPKEVVELLIDLTKPNNNETVLGIGFEPLVLRNAIGENSIIKTIQANAISERTTKLDNQKFEVILCAPLFGLVSSLDKRPNAEDCLEWGLNHIQKEGRLGIIVPAGILSNHSQKNIRKTVLDSNLLEAVIDLS